MGFPGCWVKVIALSMGVSSALATLAPSIAEAQATATSAASAERRIELGRRMYREGLRPSGEMMHALVLADIRLTGEQVVCGAAVSEPARGRKWCLR